MCGASHRLGVVIVGRVKQYAESFKPGMHDLAAHPGTSRRQAVRPIAQHLRHTAKSAFPVELQRLFTFGGKEQIVGKLHFERPRVPLRKQEVMETGCSPSKGAMR